MAIEDLLGVGKATEKLLEILANGVGGLAAPGQEKRMTKARAESMLAIGAAELEVDLKRAKAIRAHNIEAEHLFAEAATAIEGRAQERELANAVRGQQNLEAVAQFALAALPTQVSAMPVNETWQRRFFSIASDVCDEEMQTLWGQILAGEVTSPGRFSLRTLEIVRNLTTTEANAFQLACRFMIWDVNEKNGILPSIGESSFKELYRTHGLTFDTALRLQDAGLLTIQDVVLNLVPKSGFEQIRISGREVRVYSDHLDSVVSIAGMPLSNAGADLFHLAQVRVSEEFLFKVISDLEIKNRSATLRFEIEEPQGSNEYVPFVYPGAPKPDSVTR